MNDRITINAPGAGEVPVSSVDIVQLGELGPSNSYDVFLSRARSVRLDNVSAAPLMVGLHFYGAPDLHYIRVASQDVETYSSATEIERVTVWNLTNLPLPVGGTTLQEAGNGIILAGFLLVSSSTAQGTVTSSKSAGFPSGPITVTPEGGVFTVTPQGGTMQVTGPNGGMEVISTEWGYTPLLVTAPANSVNYTTPAGPIPLQVCSIIMQCTAGASGAIHVKATGHYTGIVYFEYFGPLPTQSMPFNVFGSVDNVLDFTISCGPTALTLKLGGAGVFMSESVSNVGQPPLIVSPASGSQQQVLPANSAAVQVFGTSSTGYTTARIGTIKAMFSSLYSIMWNAVLANSFIIAQNQWIYAEYVVGIEGQPSGKHIWFGGGVISVPPPSTGTTWAGDHGNIIFPFPYSTAALLPGDTQYYLSYGYAPSTRTFQDVSVWLQSA